jgi:hypothetical protein
MPAFEVANDLPMLIMQMSESRVIEGGHPVTLIENHPNRGVFKEQTGLARQKHAHILVQPQLNKVVRQPLT